MGTGRGVCRGMQIMCIRMRIRITIAMTSMLDIVRAGRMERMVWIVEMRRWSLIIRTIGMLLLVE